MAEIYFLFEDVVVFIDVSAVAAALVTWNSKGRL
jgi:hypothetical protein